MGSFLGDSALQHLLREGNVTHIIIQPGGFELSEGSSLSQEERVRRREELVKMYASRGFKVWNNRMLTPLLRVVYRIMGINEDPSCLMIGTASELKKHFSLNIKNN